MTDKTFPLKLKYWHIVLVISVMIVAFVLRFWTLLERGAFEPSFNPSPGTDMATYLGRARELTEGRWPHSPYDGQPGMIYWYSLFMHILGKDVLPLRVALAGMDAILGVGFLTGAAWLLTRRVWGGLIAGVTYAVYPVSIFFGTTLLIAPIAAQLLAMFFFVALWQRAQFSWWRAVWLGLIFGAIVAVRANLAVFAVIWVLWHWLETPNKWQWFKQVSVVTAAAIIFVAPFTYWNYISSDGEFQLMTKSQGSELYSGNDRDAHGLGAKSPAYVANDLPGNEALRRDIVIAPEHFIGLLLRKAAIHWSVHEPANGVDFNLTNDFATALNLVPLNFTHLTVIGLLGFFALWYADRRLFLWFGLMLIWLTVAMTISFGISRLRYPTVIPMILLGSYALVYAWDVVRHQPLKQTAQQFILPVILIASLVGFTNWALNDPLPLPPKRMYTELPAEAVQTNLIYGDTIELVGYRPIPDYWPAPVQGWSETDRAYTLELYWRVLEPTDIEYQFSLAYIDNGQRYAGFDYPLGAVSFPAKLTLDWNPNEIYGEIVSFRFDAERDVAVPSARSGRIHLGVYYWDEEGLIVNTPITQPIQAANAVLQTMAVYPEDADLLDVEAIQQNADFIFGDLIALHGYELPENAVPNEFFTINFEWVALQNINEDYTLFLHIVDEGGEIVAQDDVLPVAGLFTSNWQPRYVLDSSIALDAPAAGTYQVYAGLYTAAGRLPVDAPDNRVLLGEIVVE